MIDTDATNSRIWPSALHFISVLYAYTYTSAKESYVIIFNRSNLILLIAGFKIRSCIISITYNIAVLYNKNNQMIKSKYVFYFFL